MVMTDFKLITNEMPAFITPEQSPEVFAELFDQQEKIRRNSYLRFIKFKLKHIDTEGNAFSHPLTHTSEREHKGRYLYRLPNNLSEGLHRFVLTADSRTYNRTKRFNLEVRRPAEVRIDPGATDGDYEIRVRAREEFLKPSGFVAQVELQTPGGSRSDVPMERVNGGWLRGRIETSQDGVYLAHVKISAQSNAEAIVDLSLGSFSMVGLYRPPVMESESLEVETPAMPASIEAEADDALDWRLIGIVIVGVNMLLLISLLIGWLVLRRKKAPQEMVLDEEEISA